MSSYTKRIKKALGIENKIETYNDFKVFFKEASKIMIPDFMKVTFGFPEENRMIWEFDQGKCFAYTGIKKIGVINKYECGVLYRIKCWIEEFGIDHRFNPEINKCFMHHNGCCSGEIQLFF